MFCFIVFRLVFNIIWIYWINFTINIVCNYNIKNNCNRIFIKKLFWKIVLLWVCCIIIYLYFSKYVYGFRSFAYRWISFANYVIWRHRDAYIDDSIRTSNKCKNSQGTKYLLKKPRICIKMGKVFLDSYSFSLYKSMDV